MTKISGQVWFQDNFTISGISGISGQLGAMLLQCNALPHGMTEGLQLRPVQSVQNAAARPVTGARRRDHIVRILHWLPVHDKEVSAHRCMRRRPTPLDRHSTAMCAVPRSTVTHLQRSVFCNRWTTSGELVVNELLVTYAVSTSSTSPWS